MKLSKAVVQLQEVVAQLRQECPWDKKQTHESLKRHLLEEAYETIEAIDELTENNELTEKIELGENGEPNKNAEPNKNGEPKENNTAKKYDALKDELGDLLYQVFFHSLLASEGGHFEISDVMEGTYEKLHRRHPHIFGNLEIETEEELAPQWEEIKKAEKETESVMDNLSTNLPALLLAIKIQKKAKALGLSANAIKNLNADFRINLETGAGQSETPKPKNLKNKTSKKSESENKELEGSNLKEEDVPEKTPEKETPEEELAKMLWQAVSFAVENNIDAEDALRKTARKFADSVKEYEQSQN